MDHAATADPRQQGLSPTGDGKYWSFPCIAAVRGRFADHFYAYDVEFYFCRRGIPSRLVIFPDENHWVLNHGNRWGVILITGGIETDAILCQRLDSLKWHYEVFRWFDQFVGVADGGNRDVNTL